MKLVRLIACAVGLAAASCASPAATHECANGLVCQEGFVCSGDNLQCVKEGGCGNGVVDDQEECDDGNAVDEDNCVACKKARCGDNITNFIGNDESPQEECDDNNPTDEDDCLTTCKLNRCGDGFTDKQGPFKETCDDGGAPGGCYDDCSDGEGCSNGTVDVDAGEECDDGNADNTDQCIILPVGSAYRCRVARCGDGFVASNMSNPVPEECDGADEGHVGPPVETTACDIDCTEAKCGDGTVNHARGEQCDEGDAGNSDAGACTKTGPGCQRNVCGDGKHAAFEGCEDGNTVSGDGCSATCVPETCGNGIIDVDDPDDTEPAEQCDFGPPGPTGNGNANGCTADCQVAFCGDGHTYPEFEDCDDGNNVGGDECSADCKIESCGNGVIDVDNLNDADPAEQCDLGLGVNSDTGACTLACRLAFCGDGKIRALVEECDGGPSCSPQCTIRMCGNGILDPSEECDDKNGDITDGCVACKFAKCGDFAVQAVVEQCDENNTVNGDGCDTNCTISACGNGIKAGPDEQCDDDNNVAGDGCSPTCKLEKCGNGLPDPGEQCDPGALGETALCNRDCTMRACGDNKINAAAGEECDDGNNVDGDNCRMTTCKLNVCGDGNIDNADPRKETCDDGNVLNGDACNENCVAGTCGNGLVDAGEECDDANDDDTDGCLENCQAARCGDNEIWAGVEECDDGNTSNNDACLNSCKNAKCGDFFIRVGVEICDDGNNANESSCPYGSAICQTCNTGCATTTTNTGGYCGNGAMEGTEQCDDGNSLTELACAYGTPSCNICNAVCQQVARTGEFCGDGAQKIGTEVCDDGNATCGSCAANCLATTSEKAAGMIFAAAGASLVSGETFTLNDGFNPVSTFEFVTGAATPGAGHIGITFTATDTNTDLQQNIINKINGAPNLLIQATALGASFITLQHDRATTAGNKTILETVASLNFGVIDMDGGEGGNCGANQTCATNADCLSNVCGVTKKCL